MCEITFLIGDKELTMDIKDKRLDSPKSIKKVVNTMLEEE